MRKGITSIGLLSLATAALVAVAPAATAASGSDSLRIANTEGSVAVAATGQGADAAPLAAEAFPSADSTVVGSVGFVDGEQVGYFWSAARGDHVAETFGGPSKIKKAILKLDVVYNGLTNGAHVDWTVSINGTDIGRFSVAEGEIGARTEKFRFPKLTGGSYDVDMRVTNEVAGGEGAITLRYDGAGPHSISLKKK